MNEHDWIPFWLLPAAAFVAPAYAADYLTVEQAQRLLFPDARVFLEYPLKLTKEQRDQIKRQAGVRQRRETQPVWRAEQDGRLLGWFIVDEVIGKHEFITYAVALSPDGRVLGVEIMNYRETRGGEVRAAEWRGHFTGKTLADPFKLDQDVPNISGATLSCRNLTDGVKRLLVLQKVVLPDE
ncbi:MAG TPA: FMN-binding protein [Gammaproteobacteria bacterium]|nr:FMN-binding protein [Gammaproteobacteria bacterium]